MTDIILVGGVFEHIAVFGRELHVKGSGYGLFSVFSAFTISCYFPLFSSVPFSVPLSHPCSPCLFFTIVATSAWGFTLLLKRTL